MAGVPRLLPRDFDAVWKLIHELYGALDSHTLAHLVLARLPQLIASEITTLDDMHPTVGQSRHWVAPESAVPLGLMPIWQHVMHEHPVLEYVLRTGDTSAHRVSDFHSQAAFRQSRFYYEWYRLLGIEHALNTSVEVSLPTSEVVGIGLHRRGRDFSERDRNILNLLRPHLVQAYRRALVVSGLTEALEEGDAGTIVLGRNRCVLTATPKARGWTLEYFHGRVTPGARLPEPIDGWVREQRRGMGRRLRLPGTPVALLANGAGRRLIVRMLESSGGAVLHMTVEHETVTPEAIAGWRLTPREAEVLGWIIEGKTNGEIAQIVSARPRTVDKHCEHIYQKMGVENRTAAVRQALARSLALGSPLRPTHVTSGRRP